MLYVLIFLLGCFVTVAVTWLWEYMTGESHAELVRELDERKAQIENEKLLDVFVEEGFPRLGRREIWIRMGWIWKETRGLVVHSGQIAGYICLGLFAFLYTSLWFKNLAVPNPDDLRILLGGRGAVLYVLQERKS